MAETCETCQLVHVPAEVDPETPGVLQRAQQAEACIEAQKIAMKALLSRISNPVNCDGCKATVYFVRHKNGANCPYTAAGLSHFVDCPARAQFARRKA